MTNVRVMFSGIMNFAPNADKTKWGVYVPDLTADEDEHMVHQALVIVERANASTTTPPDAEDRELQAFRLSGTTKFGDSERQVRPTWHLLDDYLLKVENAKGPWDSGDCRTFDKTKVSKLALHASLESGVLEACWVDQYLWKWKRGEPQYLAEEVCLLFPIETETYELEFGKGTITLRPGSNGEVEIRIVNIPGGPSKFNQVRRDDPEEDAHAMLYYRWASREVAKGKRKPLVGNSGSPPNYPNHEHRIGGLKEFPIPTTKVHHHKGVDIYQVGGANCPPGGWGSGGP